MSSFLLSRIAGLIVFSIVGSRVGAALAHLSTFGEDETMLIFFGLGALVGLIATPWITILPLRAWRRVVNEMTIPRLALAIFGGLIGLTVGLMLAFPLSLLGETPGQLLPRRRLIGLRLPGHANLQRPRRRNPGFDSTNA